MTNRIFVHGRELDARSFKRKLVELCRGRGDLKLSEIGDLIRLNADGTIDTSFGQAGTVDLANGLIPGGISVEANGEILVPGSVPGSSSQGTTILAAGLFNSDGTPDPIWKSGPRLAFSWNRTGLNRSAAPAVLSRFVICCLSPEVSRSTILCGGVK